MEGWVDLGWVDVSTLSVTWDTKTWAVKNVRGKHYDISDVDACVWRSVRLCLSTSASRNTHHYCLTWHHQDPLQRQSWVMDAQVWTGRSAVDWYHRQLHCRYVLHLFLLSLCMCHVIILSLRVYVYLKNLSLLSVVCFWFVYCAAFMRNKLYIICTFARNGVRKLIARRYYHLCLLFTLLLSLKICFNSVLCRCCNLLNVYLTRLIASRHVCSWLPHFVSQVFPNVSVSSCLGQLLSVLARLRLILIVYNKMLTLSMTNILPRVKKLAFWPTSWRDV